MTVRVRRLTIPALVLALALLGAALPAARAASGLTLGFNPDPVMAGPASDFWINQARAEGAGIVRLNVAWSQVAPARRPPGFVAGNPDSPGYDWSSVDAEVRALSSHGLQVLINITFAPAWAEGPNRPANVQPGTWKPSPDQFAEFAGAAARRYDGAFPDPVDPAIPLPRVRYWQAWNEPNLDSYLTPQWAWTRRGFAPASPAIYRPMLNAFYAAVKSVERSDVVLTAGMAPYGNPPGVSFPGGYRMSPLTFDRVLFSGRVWCNVIAQHTYPIRGPLWHAYQPQDVSVADLYKVAALVRQGERAGHLLPRGPKQLWVTELGWNSKPPNPGGVPAAEQARWYEQALYELWRQGVDTVLLLQIVDEPPVPDYAASYQTGLYFVNGQPKPAATAFRFPFVVSASRHGHALAWGRAPVAGRVVIERLAGNRWEPLAALQVGWHQVFERRIAVSGHAVMRAQIGSQASLAWSN